MPLFRRRFGVRPTLHMFGSYSLCIFVRIKSSINQL